MIRYLLLLSLFLVTHLAFGQTSLAGKVTDGDTGEAILFGNVAVYKNGALKTGVETDLDGNYRISLDPGTYDVEFTYLGYGSKRITDVVVFGEKSNKLDMKLSTDGGVTLTEVEVVGYEIPLIQQDETSSGGAITSDQIRTLPTRDINQLAAQTAGVASTDGGDVTIKGSRSNATNYYIDGVRVSGNLIPESEISQLQVITGGASARYGDVTGGVISITSKGPSREYSGGLEAETSEYLDDFGYRLFGMNVSGPILKKESGDPILGFRVSGRYTHREDDVYPGKGVYRLKEEKLAEVEANPITNVGGTPLSTAEFLTEDDVELLSSSPYEKREDINLTAKLEARLTDNIDIAFTGTYFESTDRFTPDGTIEDLVTNLGSLLNTSPYTWQFLNAHNNPELESSRYRGIFRFRHRLGGASNAEEEGSQKNSIIRNASYSLFFSYEKDETKRADIRHGDNLFDYGYVGSFDYSWIPSYGISSYSGAEDAFVFGTPVDGVALGQVDYTPVFNGYTPVGPDHANYGLTLYNSLATEDGDFDDTDLITQNGLNTFFNSGSSKLWDRLYNNVHSIYNLNRKTEGEVYTFKAESSFELVPGGEDKGTHSISFGVLYEQRTIRNYSLSPVQLWEVGGQLANGHLQSGLDTTLMVGSVDPSMVDVFPFDPLSQPVAIFNPLSNADPTEENFIFREKVREVTGTGINEYMNIHALTPDQLSLDMFSAFELFDNNLVDYSGYDHLGNKQTGDVTFEDFFTAKSDGIRTYPIAPAEPIYTAAYLEDKFILKDIIIKAGVRVDRFDANRKVLKDPYSLYEIVTAGDFYESRDDRPAGVGDNYKVYTVGESSDVVQAFRDGDDWYFPNGSLANNGSAIFGGGVVTPRRVDSDTDIASTGFDTNTSFEDYEPQINVMPRLAFSFPISEEANFFAHYDILVQRPPSGTGQTALDFLQFYRTNTVKANANLKPERTVDYEIGFKQKITNSSAITLAAFYKELRDMIQRRTYLFVPTISEYDTYGNLDFGTVKGLSFQYDLRRTNNVQMGINYTLQFADGTGSDADSQRGLTRFGNPRYLFPFSYDERHRLNVTLDYRYEGGKRYNGPRLFGSDIFANAGVNVVVNAVSGRPYTVNQFADELSSSGVIGETNGARLPWQFKVDMRIDKSFTFSKPDSPRSLGLNVYLRVQNLLDRRNIQNVYRVTGSAEDDGYLNSANGKDQLLGYELSRGQVGVDSYTSAYQWRLLNSEFYTLPRRIYIGASLLF